MLAEEICKNEVWDETAEQSDDRRGRSGGFGYDRLGDAGGAGCDKPE